MKDIYELLEDNSYVGRGIIIGLSEDGLNAVLAYFIMGRSTNSRNRVFELINNELYTRPYDISKVEDPSLIIYPAVKNFGSDIVVSNGDHTDTIITALSQGIPYKKSLDKRAYEPDYPNYTSRISGILHLHKGFSYEMGSIRRLENGECGRFFYDYNPEKGVGHFIHTYKCDGNPIPAYEGEPEEISIPRSIDDFADAIWAGLNIDNKVSLYVRYISLKDGTTQERLINKNK